MRRPPRNCSRSMVSNYSNTKTHVSFIYRVDYEQAAADDLTNMKEFSPNNLKLEIKTNLSLIPWLTDLNAIIIVKIVVKFNWEIKPVKSPSSNT